MIFDSILDPLYLENFSDTSMAPVYFYGTVEFRLYMKFVGCHVVYIMRLFFYSILLLLLPCFKHYL